jgi:hypothetical protein
VDDNEDQSKAEEKVNEEAGDVIHDERHNPYDKEEERQCKQDEAQGGLCPNASTNWLGEMRSLTAISKRIQYPSETSRRPRWKHQRKRRRDMRRPRSGSFAFVAAGLG